MTPTLLVPFPDGAILEFVHSIAGKVAINRLWLLNRQPPTTQAQVDALASAASSYWAANMQVLQSSDCELVLVRASAWDSPGAGPVGFVLPGTFGSVAEESYSASVAIRLTFQGFTGSRNFRNGNFFAGVPDSAVDINTIDSSYADALHEAYVGIIDAAPGWGSFPAWRWVTVSLVEAGVLRSSVRANRVDHVVINSPYISPQRRRVAA